MSQPRIGVVGGGLCGTMAALTLRSRGLQPTILNEAQRSLGGRLAGGVRHPDSGAQFFRASEAGSQWASVLAMLAREGLVAPWTGRFGLLGARGGFLPREVLGSTPLGAMLKEDSASASGGVDFCGFLAGAEQPVLVGTPSNGSICDGICAAAAIDVRLRSRVLDATPLARGGWRLAVERAATSERAGPPTTEHMEFDALIVATHDARLAAGAVASLATGDEAAGARLQQLSEALVRQREESTAAVFTWSAYFPIGTSAKLPFDAVTAPSSSIVHFAARDASKPGRPPARELPPSHRSQPTGVPVRSTLQGELWTAVPKPGPNPNLSPDPNAGLQGELWTAVSKPGFAQVLRGATLECQIH